MELIDRYVHAVGQHLPASMRADVAAELRSLLAESLDERARASGAEPTEALAKDVIREFGQPREVAARYAHRPQYLIGPPLYPVYVTVTKIQLAVIAGISLFMLITGHYRAPGEPGSLVVVARAVGSAFSAIIQNLGVTTLVFALIEMAIRGRAVGSATWDPSSLPRVDDPQRVSFAGTIVEIYLLATVAVVFNLFPDWVGIVMVDDHGPRVVSLLEPEFRRYLPLMNGAWAVAFVLHVVVLRDGCWRRVTRWWEVGLDACTAGILAAIVMGPPVFRFDPYVKLALSVFVAVTVVKAGIRVYRLVTTRPPREPWAAPTAR